MVKLPETDQLSLTFGALSDPTRREILRILMRGEKSVNELAEPFEMTLPAVSKHIKVLEKAGLIERSREAQSRPCRIKAKPLKEANEWIAKYKKFWEDRLDQLDDYLRDIQNRDIQTKVKLGAKKSNQKEEI